MITKKVESKKKAMAKEEGNMPQLHHRQSTTPSSMSRKDRKGPFSSILNAPTGLEHCTLHVESLDEKSR